jgi:hypothetical protein
VTRDGAKFPNIDPEIDELLHPSRFYARPTDVVADQLLTVDERRAILSSWASDACAVESNPALRQPPHAKTPVTFDEIMDALLQLDRLKGCSIGCQTRPTVSRSTGRAPTVGQVTRPARSDRPRAGSSIRSREPKFCSSGLQQ